LYAIDAASGAHLWSALTGGNVQASPAVVNGVVYSASLDGKLSMFDLNVGPSSASKVPEQKAV
jgi:outer membrane protein assembly factor BamB